MRLRNDKNALAKIAQASCVLSHDVKTKLDPSFVIELGMGKGEMLIALAQSNPQVNYLGIEKYPTLVAAAASKVQALALKNIVFLCADIKQLPELIEGKCHTIWLTFSDPWPKARHVKRRLTHQNFLQIYAQILAKDGLLKIKTDNDALFAFTIEQLNLLGADILHQTNDLHRDQEYGLSNVFTRYEQKFASRDKKINFLVAQFP